MAGSPSRQRPESPSVDEQVRRGTDRLLRDGLIVPGPYPGTYGTPRSGPSTQSERRNNAIYWNDRARNHDVIGEGNADTMRQRPAARVNGAPSLGSFSNDSGMSNRLIHDPSKTPLPPLAPAGAQPAARGSTPGSDAASQAAAAARGGSMGAMISSMAANVLGSTSAANTLRAAGSLGLRVALPASAVVAAGWGVAKGYEAYQQGADARGIASAAGWAAADSITVGIASMAWKQGESAYALWGQPKTASKQPDAPANKAAFAKANAQFRSRAQAEPVPEQPGRKKGGWSNAARVAAAQARGAQLPYNGNPEQGPAPWRPKES